MSIRFAEFQFNYDNQKQIHSIQHVYLNINMKKLIFQFKLKNGLTKYSDADFDFTKFLSNNSLYYQDQQQVIKIIFDIHSKKYLEYKIFKGLFHFEDIKIVYFNDPHFFKQALNLFDKKMNNHNGIIIPYTGVDKNQDFYLRNLIVIGSSGSNPSVEGNFFTKSFDYVNSKKIAHNINKPYSTIVDKLRDVSDSDLKTINILDKEVSSD